MDNKQFNTIIDIQQKILDTLEQIKNQNDVAYLTSVAYEKNGVGFCKKCNRNVETSTEGWSYNMCTRCRKNVDIVYKCSKQK